MIGSVAAGGHRDDDPLVLLLGEVTLGEVPLLDELHLEHGLALLVLLLRLERLVVDPAEASLKRKA